MSIQSNFPAIKPTLLLDFANVEQLDPRVTFSRASTATYYGTQTAKAEENLLIRSQEFDNATWTATNLTVSANTTVAPDGTSTADTLTDDATNGVHRTLQSPPIVANTIYAASVFVKAGTHNFVQLMVRDGGIAERYFTVVANLSSGTISQTGVGTSGTLVSSSIVALPDSWYRIQIVGSLSAVSSGQISIGFAGAATGNTITNFGTISYVGTGTTYFAWGAQLEQRSAATAYTPTTTQPITNYIPVLLTAASGVPRFDHNPTTFESLGLLIEEQRTNLFTYSEQFDNAAWTKNATTITANTVVAPDGTLTGDKLIATAVSASHDVARVISVTSGSAYTFSFYAKAGELGYAGILFAAAGFGTNTVDVFDLLAGTVSFNASGAATITPVGGGWYRCAATRTATASTPSTFQIREFNNSVGTQFTGDGVSGIYIWGAQLE